MFCSEHSAKRLKNMPNGNFNKLCETRSIAYTTEVWDILPHYWQIWQTGIPINFVKHKVLHILRTYRTFCHFIEKHMRNGKTNKLCEIRSTAYIAKLWDIQLNFLKIWQTGILINYVKYDVLHILRKYGRFHKISHNFNKFGKHKFHRNSQNLVAELSQSLTELDRHIFSHNLRIKCPKTRPNLSENSAKILSNSEKNFAKVKLSVFNLSDNSPFCQASPSHSYPFS